jgi:S-DNA-T family DNA segregation ATPase FtsK/SpoIIIE
VEALGRLTAELTARLPGGQLRAARSDGVAPEEWVVVIDDADLLPAATASAVAGLAPLLRHGIDIGFGLVLARPVTGWCRAAYEPVLQALRDSGPSTLLLSGDPAEGVIMSGVRARRAPPGRGRWIPSDGATVAVQLYREDPPRAAAEPADAGRSMPPQWRQGAA